MNTEFSKMSSEDKWKTILILHASFLEKIELAKSVLSEASSHLDKKIINDKVKELLALSERLIKESEDATKKMNQVIDELENEGEEWKQS
jgi:hypothetical protein